MNDSDDFLESLCPLCGHAMEWEHCWAQCDEGYIDRYEEDPLWFDPGDLEPCPECQGRGGYWQCPNVPHKEEPPWK